jgi:hypothetical protein
MHADRALPQAAGQAVISSFQNESSTVRMDRGLGLPYRSSRILNFWRTLLQFFGEGVECVENGSGRVANDGANDRAGEKCGDEARRSGRHRAALHRGFGGLHPAGGEAWANTAEGDCRSASPTGAGRRESEGTQFRDTEDRAGTHDSAGEAT